MGVLWPVYVLLTFKPNPIGSAVESVDLRWEITFHIASVRYKIGIGYGYGYGYGSKIWR